MELCALTTVVPQLADPQAARVLLEHPRVGRMTSDGNVFSYLDPVTHRLVTLRGITRRLRELYWPDMNPFGTGAASTEAREARAARAAGAAKKKRAPLPARARAPAPSETSPVSAVRAAQQAVVTAARGATRGSMVHQHVSDLMTLDAASFSRRYPAGPHPWAPRVLAALLGRGWLPLAADYLVCAEDAGYGTGIDLLWATPSGVPVFIELKTSASRHAFAATRGVPLMAGSMGGSGLRQTPLHCALVQLLAGVLMAVRGVGLRGPLEAWVVHVDDAAVDFFQLDAAFMLAHGPALWADLHGPRD